MQINEEKYSFLKTGYASFPLNDIGKEFEVIYTFDIDIDKPRFIDIKKSNKYMQLHMNYKEIENKVWSKIKEEHKELIIKADWLVISMISELKDKLMISLDILKEIK